MRRDRRVDVIIPSYQSWDSLALVLDALREQVQSDARTVTVVDSTGGISEEVVHDRWPWARFILLDERTLPGRARNLGVAAGDADLIAFIDADAVPENNWLDRLVAAVDGYAAVAGSIENGTPRSPTGTAQYFLEFAEWLPERRSALMHAATCNLIVHRDAFNAAGGFREDLWPGEDTVLTLQWGRAGMLGFAPDAVVSHLNRRGLREFVKHQVRLGASFGQVCRSTAFPFPIFRNRLWAPIAAAMRVLSVANQLRPAPRRLAMGMVLCPLLIAGLAAWGFGLAAGGHPWDPARSQ